MSDDLHDDPTSDSSVDRDPVEQLAEEFLGRRRQGEGASISEYAETHPQLAQRIREIFPTLLLDGGSRPDTTSRAVAAPWRRHRPRRRWSGWAISACCGRSAAAAWAMVYEAEQESLGRRVALKVLPAVCVASPTRLQRFLREAQAAARLHHTNIVPVFGVGQQDGIRYYVMQFIAGQGLDVVVHALARWGDQSQGQFRVARRSAVGGGSPAAAARFPPAKRPRCCLRDRPRRTRRRRTSLQAQTPPAVAGDDGGHWPAPRYWQKRGADRDPGGRRPASMPTDKGRCTATSSRPTC